MTTRTLDFYFDFISPFAWFAWRRLPALCAERDVSLVAHPVIFGKLLDHWGQLGPAEIVPKRNNIYASGYRYAAMHGFEFNPPKFHPYNPLTTLRIAQGCIAGSDQKRVIDTLFEAGWSAGADLGDAAEVVGVLNAVGLDGSGLLERAKGAEAKDSLRRETELAIARGVFGVPTMVVDEELFWGNDQVEQLAVVLDGRDPLDRVRLAEFLARGRAIDRKARQNP